MLDRSYQRELKRCQMFSREEERALWLRRRTDEEARRKLIESMLQYVVLWVTRWVTRRECAIDRQMFDDLLGEANLTLVDVVDNHFDPAKGRLSTILSCYLRKCAGRYLARQYIARVPDYYIGKGNRVWRYQDYANKAMRPTKCLVEAVRVNELRDLDVNVQDIEKRGSRFSWIRKTLKLMDDIPWRNKELFLNHVCGGVSYCDLGQRYHLSKAWVIIVIKRIRKRLREQYLLEQGYKQDGSS